MWNVKGSVDSDFFNEFIISHFKKLLTVEKLQLLKWQSFNTADVDITRCIADNCVKKFSQQSFKHCVENSVEKIAIKQSFPILMLNFQSLDSCAHAEFLTALKRYHTLLLSFMFLLIS